MGCAQTFGCSREVKFALRSGVGPLLERKATAIYAERQDKSNNPAKLRTLGTTESGDIENIADKEAADNLSKLLTP